MKNFMLSKRLQLFIVLTISASIIATGSYAWSSFRAEFTMPARSVIPDNVLLMDFSEQGGEIYAVNCSSQSMLIRARLDEWMEIDGKAVSPREYVSLIYGKSVISFSEWRQSGTPVGDYWIADSDGWYYYAKQLSPGESTRMLLQEVKQSGFSILVKGSHSIVTSLQAVPAGDIDELIALDKDNFSNSGALLMKYVGGEMVEFVR